MIVQHCIPQSITPLHDLLGLTGKPVKLAVAVLPLIRELGEEGMELVGDAFSKEPVDADPVCGEEKVCEGAGGLIVKGARAATTLILCTVVRRKHVVGREV